MIRVVFVENQIFNFHWKSLKSISETGGTKTFVPSQDGIYKIDVSILPAGLYFNPIRYYMKIYFVV